MKKCLSALLALCLICVSFALAEGAGNAIEGSYESPSGGTSSRLTYTIPLRQNYVVTIPSSIDFELDEEDCFSGEMEIALSSADFNHRGSGIAVTLSGAAFALKYGKNSIPYQILDSADQPLSLGDRVLDWFYDSASSDLASAKLTVSGSVAKNVPNGAYTDTLTFTLSVYMPETN